MIIVEVISPPITTRASGACSSAPSPMPRAIGIGEGGELQAPLARVVIGGLLASTMITLVFVPVVYTLFEEGWKGLFRPHAAKHS